MQLAGQVGRVLLTCVIWTAVPVLLWSDFKLAYVTEHSLYMCSCVHGLAPCGVINSSQCNCDDRPLSTLHRGDSSGPVHKRLTVWYTSPLHVALLLNNSEVRHLSLVRCKAPGPRGASYQYFTVQRLERLTVSYWQGELGHSVDLGPHTEEERVAVIHTSILTGKATLKAYTVQTKVDANGVLPFPNICMSPAGLPATAVMFVTFLY
ncbi:hypothetical protein SKAU_G00167720 [Synaphobranchus kaupii]|uniref:Uncharacterized protein n=1 Tax=Synaphobranchus kaupii TaxID=118154 RepID=A0A9Q1FJS4_SYNKA|nr:hypothetical protein SKAU_G00167720 [Synaphobranchus kaupii]